MISQMMFRTTGVQTNGISPTCVQNELSEENDGVEFIVPEFCTDRDVIDVTDSVYYRHCCQQAKERTESR